MCCAAQSAADKAGEWMSGVKDKAEAMVQEAVDANK